MLVISILVSDGNVAIVMAALAGACIGFMPYNLNPAKIFMGDSGALLLGYILSTTSIIGLFKFYAIVSFAAPILVVALPLFDTAFAFVRRILKGQSPMHADRGHLHHRLIDLGLSQKQAVAILYSVSAVMGLVAVVLTTTGVMKAVLLVATLIIAVIVTIFVTRTTHHAYEEQKKNGNGYGISVKKPEENV
jgi:UDP-GlcNAc:undecaprenyl-phosphate GlcNAc-1-phosphate transferase